jgi:uncharacterized protein (DUF885 family)
MILPCPGQWHWVVPGHLTTYDVGAAEFFYLRELAEKELDERFDIRKFHSAVLNDGVVPLWMLRENISAWIAKQSKEN